MWIGQCNRNYECLQKISELCNYIATKDPISEPWMKVYQGGVSEIKEVLRKKCYNVCPFSDKICENFYLPEGWVSKKEIRKLKKTISEIIDTFRNKL